MKHCQQGKNTNVNDFLSIGIIIIVVVVVLKLFSCFSLLD